MTTTPVRKGAGSDTGNAGHFAAAARNRSAVALPSPPKPIRRRFDNRAFEIRHDDAPAAFTIHEGGEQIGDFNFPGEPGDEDAIWAAAKSELASSGDIELCSRCSESLEDNQGWDGLCGDCADAAERVVFVEQFKGEEVSITHDEYGEEYLYAVEDGDGKELAQFTFFGDPEDHSEIWDAAQEELPE